MSTLSLWSPQITDLGDGSEGVMMKMAFLVLYFARYEHHDNKIYHGKSRDIFAAF